MREFGGNSGNSGNSCDSKLSPCDLKEGITEC